LSTISQSETKEILRKCKVIAVVGLSNDTTKPSFIVSAYLKSRGYRIIPVNPTVSRVLGENCYSSLLAIPPKLQKTIDVVDVFRKSEDVPSVVKQAIELKQKCGCPSVVWMQHGIVNEEAAAMARQAGLDVVMDKCMMEEHKRSMKT
jgi:predicted CoA-binding protein